jgi:predicted Zn-dependent protease
MNLPATAQSPQGAETFESLLKQGFALHQQSRFPDAISVLERARKLEPGDYFVNLLLGIDLLRTGKPTEAVPRLKLAARAKPDEEFPEDYLGEAEATLGENALAAEAFQQAILRGHNSEQALESWSGFALERFRQIGEELRASEQGLAVARRLQKAASMPELLSGSAPDCAASIPALERRFAVKRMHFEGETAYQLSICYATEAGKAAESLQSGTHDIAAMHRLRGDVLLRLKGDAPAAEAEYRQAIAAQPGDPVLLERLAEAQLSAGDTDGARQSARAALGVDPHLSSALHTLAELSMSDRDYDQALPLLRQLTKEAPGDRTARVELGRALAETGHPDEALQWLAPALATGYPDDKGALHALMARALRKLGRAAEAALAEAEARRLSNAYQARGAAAGADRDSGKPAHPEGPDAD